MDERERAAGEPRPPAESSEEKTASRAAETSTRGIAVSLEKYFDLQRLSRRRSALIALLALGMVGLTVTLCYRELDTNFAPEHLERSASAEAQKLLPSLSEHALALIREVRPTYEEEGKRALRAAVPRLQEQLEREFVHLGESLASRTETTIGTVLPRTAEKVLVDFYTAFPDLADEAYVQETLDRLKHEIRAETQAVIDSAWQTFRTPTERLAATLGRFPSLEEMPDGDLERRFIHLWLMLLDHELMAGSEAPSTGAEPAGREPRRS